MIKIEVLAKAPTVNDPNEIAVEGLTAQSFGVSHAGVLDFNDDAGGRLDVGSVDFTIGRLMRNLSAVFGKMAFPLSMPRCFVFPPGIAVATSGVCPVMHNARPALGDHARTAGRADPLSS